MGKITGTFDELWTRDLEPAARTEGVIDGDLPTVRSKVKAALISAGWAQPDGAMEFLSEKDFDNALDAADQVLLASSARVKAERQVRHAQYRVGSTPTKAQVLKANVEAGKPSEAKLMSAAPNRGFTPRKAQMGDKCPRCSGSMAPVKLVNDKAAIYCDRDRVVLPLSDDAVVR